ncbi:hypothetical protein QQ045_022006 [Rhodiola kirilowii]
MHRRTRSIPISAESFNRYLKPDALARIRDSRITARSHRVHTVPSFHRPLSSSTPVPASPSAINQQIDASPCFPAGCMVHDSLSGRSSLLLGRCATYKSHPYKYAGVSNRREAILMMLWRKLECPIGVSRF